MNSAPSPSRGRALGLLNAMRPRQWVKNGVVVVAPLAAGILSQKGIITHTAAAFVSFCLISSGVYLFNDLSDRDRDRVHPTKRFRAIASGEVSFSLALVAGVVLLLAGFVIPLFLWHPSSLLLVLGIYVLVQLAYILGAKHLPVIELACVASGFFLRALAGAEASHLYVSEWFLVVIGFGALFLVAGKRAAELQTLGEGAANYRPVLSEYSPEFMRGTLVMTATIVMTTYCLWAFDNSSSGLSSIHHHVAAIRLTVIPVLLVILHILRLLEAGGGAAPEDLVLTDRTVQSLGAIWTLLFVVGIY